MEAEAGVACAGIARGGSWAIVGEQMSMCIAYIAQRTRGHVSPAFLRTALSSTFNRFGTHVCDPLPEAPRSPQKDNQAEKEEKEA